MVENFAGSGGRALDMGAGCRITQTPVSNCYKSQKTREKAVDTYLFMLECVPNCYKTKEPLMLKYRLD